MVTALVYLGLMIHRAIGFMCRSDPSISHSYFGLWCEYLRGSRRNILPQLRQVLKYTAVYFKPSFHPASIGSTAQAVAYLATSPAARRARR